MGTLWAAFSFLVVAAVASAGAWVVLWIFNGCLALLHRQDLRAVELAERQAELQRKRNEAKLVRANVDLGDLPLPADQLLRGELSTALLTLAAHHIEAQRLPANVPQTMTYAPHMVSRGEAARLVEPAGLLPAAPMPPQDFWSLYSGGQLPQDKFLLGYSLESGEAITATWKELYSSLVGGQSGSGKSTLIRSVLAQSALQGGQFVVLDPHYGAGEESLGASLEPLHSRLMMPIASNDKQMLDALRYTQAIAKARLAGDSDRTPVVLVCDETTGLLQRGNIAEELTTLFGLISQESRKVGVFAFAIGQQWSSEVLPTTVRNSFVSMLSCRARRDVARIMSGSNEFGKLAESLTTGQAVWQSPSGETHKLAVPNCTQAHLAMVAKTIDGVAEPVATLSLKTSTAEASPISDTISGDSATIRDFSGATASHEVDPQRNQHVRALVRAGRTRSEIMREIWGVERGKGGPKFTQAGRELDEVMRVLVQ